MAETKTPVAPTQTAPTTEAPAPKPKRQPTGEEFYPTADAAIAACEGRTKGARRAYKLTFQGKDHFLVSHNNHHAGGVIFRKLGGVIEEIGKVRAARQPMTAEAILAALNALPESERAIVTAQMKSLHGGKKS